MQVKVRGVVYASVRECCEALGVKKSTVYVALGRGREDTIGVGRGTWDGCRNNRTRPVVVGGMQFRTMKDLSLWLGKNQCYVSTCEIRGHWDRVVGLVMKKIAAQEEAARREDEMEDHRRAGRESWEKRRRVAR